MGNGLIAAEEKSGILCVFCCGTLFFLSSLIQLIRVEYIVPYAVEASSDGGDRCEEGVGHPDGKDGVFLPDGLPGSNAVAIRDAEMASYVELCPTTDKGHYRYADKGRDGYVAVHDGTCGDGNGHGQRDGPQVEGCIAGIL